MQTQEQKKPRRTLKFIIPLIVFIVLFIILLFPIRHTVKGTITDWIGNDNGFGLQINGEIFWLDYEGEYISPVSMPYIVGHNCTLIYEGIILSPNGDCPFYAHMIVLVVE